MAINDIHTLLKTYVFNYRNQIKQIWQEYMTRLQKYWQKSEISHHLPIWRPRKGAKFDYFFNNKKYFTINDIHTLLKNDVCDYRKQIKQIWQEYMKRLRKYWQKSEIACSLATCRMEKWLSPTNKNGFSGLNISLNSYVIHARSWKWS